MIPGLDASKLVNVKSVADGWLCGCPICIRESRDSTKNHLKIFHSGKFHCIGVGDDRSHNREIYNFLYGNGETVEYIEPEPKIQIDKIYPESMLSKLVPDYSYWLNRGISEATLKLFEGGVAPMSERGRLSGRFVFPIRGLDGSILGWIGRLIDDDQFGPKYKILGRVSQAVFPLVLAKQSIIETKTVVVLESIGDALRLKDHGIHNALIMFGLIAHSKLISAMISLDVKRVIISTNNDEKTNHAGNKAAEKIKICLDNYWGSDKVIIRHPKSKDWGEASIEEIETFKTEINGPFSQSHQTA
jgi:Toprim-like